MQVKGEAVCYKWGGVQRREIWSDLFLFEVVKDCLISKWHLSRVWKDGYGFNRNLVKKQLDIVKQINK